MLLRETVNKAVAQYMEVREKIGWTDKGKSASILRLAKPFQTGYFTIAVAGKTSSGKSTFINSLIGEELLPTGHFQTTSAITWIISSDNRYMDVTFADGHTKRITDNLADELRVLVAVPQKFHSLPINHINLLIAGGDDMNTILQKKESIEEETQTSSDASLWKEYVAQNPIENIVDKVEIYLQLPDEYKGWRIIDTPGVGAIGGIQDTTKELLTAQDKESSNNIVDAVILLHNGKENIEDESANSFAKEVSKSMGDLASGRLFFVLTHASAPEFTNNMEGILSRAETQFGTRLNIPKERLTYVDSLIHHFLIDAIKSKKDFSNFMSLMSPLEGWDIKEWKVVQSIVMPLYSQIVESGKEINNNTLFSELKNASRFDNLREILYEFLNQEKEKTFSDLLNMIKSELKSYGVSLKREIRAVSNGKEEIEKQIEEAKKEGSQLNHALVKVQQTASPIAIDKSFAFIESGLQELKQIPHISEIRTKYLEIVQKGISTEQEFFETLISDFSNYAKDFSNTSTTFTSLDLNELEREATANSMVIDKDRWDYETVKKGSGRKERVKVYNYKKVDVEKKRRDFLSVVISKGDTYRRSFITRLKAKVNNFFDIVSKDIDAKTEATISRLKNYMEDLDNRDAILKNLNAKLSFVDLCLTELKKLED